MSASRRSSACTGSSGSTRRSSGGCRRSSSGAIERPIGRHPKDRKRMAVVAGGKRALTHYRARGGRRHARRAPARHSGDRPHPSDPGPSRHARPRHHRRSDLPAAPPAEPEPGAASSTSPASGGWRCTPGSSASSIRSAAPRCASSGRRRRPSTGCSSVFRPSLPAPAIYAPLTMAPLTMRAVTSAHDSDPRAHWISVASIKYDALNLRLRRATFWRIF